MSLQNHNIQIYNSQKDDQQAIAESVQLILFFSFFYYNLTQPNNKAQNSKLVLDLLVFSIFRQKNTIEEWLPKFLAQPINLHARCEFRTHTLGIKSSCALSSALNLSLDAIAIVGGGDGFTFKSFVVPSYAMQWHIFSTVLGWLILYTAVITRY